jgi:hypothetical protein
MANDVVPDDVTMHQIMSPGLPAEVRAAQSGPKEWSPGQLTPHSLAGNRRWQV